MTRPDTPTPRHPAAAPASPSQDRPGHPPGHPDTPPDSALEGLGKAITAPIRDAAEDEGADVTPDDDAARRGA